MRRSAAISVVLALVSSFTVLAAAPASASPDEGDGCYPTNYGVKYEIRSATSSPVVTHAWNKVLAPGGSWNRKTTITKVNYVEASVQYHAEASIGADKVIAKAELKVGVDLRVAGSHTRTTSIEENVSIHNSTGKNREYVVFSGTVKHSGRYKKWWCNNDYTIGVKYGNWKSWSVVSDGTVRCDLSAPNRVAKKAKALYCG